MKIYKNQMMPQRGGWWPECLGTFIIGIVAAVSIVLGAGYEIAHASPKIHSTGSANYWQNVDYDWLSQESGGNYTTESSSQSNGSLLGLAFDCSSGYCEHSAYSGGPGCFTWQSATNTIDVETCNDLDRQLWEVYNEGNGFYLWINDYANTYWSNHGYCTGDDPALTNHGNGDDDFMKCPEGGSGLGGYNNDQIWYGVNCGGCTIKLN